MRAEVRADYEWQRQFIPRMKQLVGLYVAVDEAPAEEDMRHNTDLIVLETRLGVRVACRARGLEKYRREYGDQFTLRADRPSGFKTELPKLLEGWGDFLLYGFGRRDNRFIGPARYESWTLARLDIFRDQVARQPGLIHPNRWKRNDDGTMFVPFRWSYFPPEFVIATERRKAPPQLIA